MTTKYTVFDIEINRLHGVYDTKDEAVQLVGDLLRANADDYADDLAIIPRSETGEYGEPLTGNDLRACLRVAARNREPIVVRR